MKLTKNSHLLIKHTLMLTGEKEIAPDGKEIDASLRLNGEESSQRRFYLKALEEMDTPQTLYKEAKEKWEKENPIGKEPQQVYDMKFNQVFNEKEMPNVKKKMEEEFEVKITDKTLAVVKKYFKEFGEKAGWVAEDDKSVEEITLEFNK